MQSAANGFREFPLFVVTISLTLELGTFPLLLMFWTQRPRPDWRERHVTQPSPAQIFA